MKIPHKFTFHNGNSLLKLTNIQGTYYCTLPHVEADTISSAVYDRLNVEHKLHTGKWKIVADLTTENKEPEMKFPITAKWSVPTSIYKDSNVYVFTKDVSTGKVSCSWSNNSIDYPEDMLKKAIKMGHCLVQSVGEQGAKEEPANYSVDIDDKGNVAGHGMAMEKHTVGNVSSLTIKIGSEGIDETTAKMERLAQATENVTMAFESLQSIMEEMGMSFGGDVNVQTFCCSEI
jgi:hypothetical protein